MVIPLRTFWPLGSVDTAQIVQELGLPGTEQVVQRPSGGGLPGFAVAQAPQAAPLAVPP